MNLLHLLTPAMEVGRPIVYESLTWRRRLWPTNQGADLDVTLRASHAASAGLAEGSYLVVRDDLRWGADPSVYILDKPERDTGVNGDDSITITGSLVAKAIGTRAVIPPAGLSHDAQTAVAAETAIKHYWTDHASSGAPTERQWPDLTIEGDGAQGGTVTISARYQTLTEVSAVAGVTGGVGWEVVYRLAEKDFRLRAVVGSSKPNVVFTVSRLGTANRVQVSGENRGPNVAIVLGQGEGAARTVVTVWNGTEPTGADRRETVIDARDTDDTDTLTARGLAALTGSEADTVKVTTNPFGSLRYREAWDLGDVVPVEEARWGWSVQQRIVGVTHRHDADSQHVAVEAEIGHPWPQPDELTDDTDAAFE